MRSVTNEKGREKNMENKAVLFELNIEKNDRCKFPNTILDAVIDANEELKELEDKLNETLETIEMLTPKCDKLDYILSVSSGALCGIIDVFLVGKPGESPLGDIIDKWFVNRTIDFAKICGYTGDKNSLSSAIKFLEKKFKIPYDQSVGGGIFRELIDLTPSNHHFKSLGHNPTRLGLFFSILNQFTNTSDFVSNGNEDFEKFVSWKDKKTDIALCCEFKTLIISLTNFLYKIDIDDKDKKLLYRTFKDNKKMLRALNIKKKDFKIDILDAVEEALAYSYK